MNIIYHLLKPSSVSWLSNLSAICCCPVLSVVLKKGDRSNHLANKNTIGHFTVVCTVSQPINVSQVVWPCDLSIDCYLLVLMVSFCFLVTPVSIKRSIFLSSWVNNHWSWKYVFFCEATVVPIDLMVSSVTFFLQTIYAYTGKQLLKQKTHLKEPVSRRSLRHPIKLQ